MDGRMFGGEHKVRPYDFIMFVVGANLVFALMPKSCGSPRHAKVVFTPNPR
uniref:Uncharacterized protein n=1 Tax=Candidatus Kentrum sp. FM TaxID=2126340 RepID=A0A450SBT8_9GAMM|nr:MAG: hypothetical protein BECKFM1743C_GA0114222_100747 [Candidatus Kentron sp. FM]VFK08146.1 MAG: hypothetical protein BECKFM1743B_GA0114221_100606 [Candidatus Kentron sp. FM]